MPQALLLPLEAGAGGHGCSTCGAEMKDAYALTFRVCSRACGSASEALDPCKPRRAEIRDKLWKNLEEFQDFGNSSSLASTVWPLVSLILWHGRIHAQLLLVSPSLETPCLDFFAVILLPLGEASGTPRPLLWVRVLPTTLYPKRPQEGWAAAQCAPLALLRLTQGTWMPFSHHPPTPSSHLPHPTAMPERGYLFSQTSWFIPDIPLLTWMG